jgi:hypothetical protein
MWSASTGDQPIVLDWGERRSYMLDNNSPTFVKVADVSLLFRIPRRTGNVRFLENWKRYRREVNLAVPRVAGLLLERPGGPTLQYEGPPVVTHSRPKYRLREDIVLGSGAFGTVFEVRETSTGVRYAGKRFNNPNEATLKEFKIMKGLHHVSCY